VEPLDFLFLQALIDQANQNSEKARAIMDLYVRIRPASGRRSEVLAFGQLINLAEGRKVI
jgi:hypothetical protein